MNSQNTTPQKQEDLIQFFMEMGYTREKVEFYFKNPDTRAIMNAMADRM